MNWSVWGATAAGILLEVLCARQGAAANDPAFELRIAGDPESPAIPEVVVMSSVPWAQLRGAADADAGWESVLTLRLVEAGGKATAGAPPVAGRYREEGSKLHFRPAFPLLPGRVYVARFDPAALGIPGNAAELLHKVAAPAADAEAKAPRIEAIYPSGDVVPANHLKFYLVFSESMRRNGAFKFCRILDARGAEVPEPFRETDLWSEGGRRLTLWLHPGRQKTGVNLNLEIGPVLEAGGEYRLIISGDWQSEVGIPLGRETVKKFRAVAADEVQPVAAAWTLTAPMAGTMGALRLEFPEPLDWALLRDRLRVEDAAGDEVAGRVTVGDAERSWSYIPVSSWAPGAYRVAVASILEDLAGNSLARPFELDVSRGDEADTEVEAMIFLSFEVKE